jgi:hypothetical protein
MLRSHTHEAMADRQDLQRATRLLPAIFGRRCSSFGRRGRSTRLFKLPQSNSCRCRSSQCPVASLSSRSWSVAAWFFSPDTWCFMTSVLVSLHCKEQIYRRQVSSLSVVLKNSCRTGSWRGETNPLSIMTILHSREKLTRLWLHRFAPTVSIDDDDNCTTTMAQPCQLSNSTAIPMHPSPLPLPILYRFTS